MASIKDLKRMCKSREECNNCPLFIEGVARCKTFNFPNNVEEIIDKWVQENPVKTYAQDFFEKFPNAQRDTDGTPQACMNNLYGDITSCSATTCVACWNQELKEDV